nr:hypothetical protein [Tanacetum cinerariifolium]
MIPLTFVDTHNMVAYLSMSDTSVGFDQIVDFLNARVILMVNPTIYVSCIKQFWASATIKKVNDVVQLRVLINRKKVVVTEDVIRQDLRLDNADGVECLPNEEIFAELARMGYEKLPPKLMSYKAFFSAQQKFLIHTLVQCVSAKRTAWNEFSCSMASTIICLVIGRKFNFSKYIFDSMVRNMDSPSKFLMYPRFLLVFINNQVDDLSSHTTRYRSPALTQKVFANMRRVGKGFSRVETPLFASMLVQPQPQAAEEEDDVEGRKDDDNAASKDFDAAEPTMFDDEEVTMTIAQTLIKMKTKKARLLDEQMAKRLHDKEVEQAATREKQEKDDLKRAKARKNMIIYLKNMAGYKMKHFRGMTYDKVKPIFEREYNKVQTLFKPDKDVEEPKKKRVTEQTLLHESFKKLKAVKVSGSDSTQEIPANDPKEMSKEDVQNMLEIVPVVEN